MQLLLVKLTYITFLIICFSLTEFQYFSLNKFLPNMIFWRFHVFLEILTLLLITSYNHFFFVETFSLVSTNFFVISFYGFSLIYFFAHIHFYFVYFLLLYNLFIIFSCIFRFFIPSFRTLVVIFFFLCSSLQLYLLFYLLSSIAVNNLLPYVCNFFSLLAYFNGKRISCS